MIVGMMMALGLVIGAAPAAADGTDAKEAARARLEMHPGVLTPDVQRRSNLAAHPRRLRLKSAKPDRVAKEPAYAGSPRYLTIEAGSGPMTDYVLAFDDAADPPKLYLDADQDGDLTDDPPVAWDAVKTDEGRTTLETLLRLPVSWTEPSGRVTTGIYGLSLRKTRGADIVYLARAGARTGEIEIDGKKYAVALAENTDDAVFDNAHASETKKPGVWLMIDLDGDRNFGRSTAGREVFDTSRPFQIAGSWYIADFPEDGSEVSLRRTEAPPLPAGAGPRTPLLAAGQTMPDFAIVHADGRKGRFAETNGRIRVVDLWATWCGPCIAAMPHVEALHQQVKDQGVQVIGLDVLDDEASYKSWMAEKKGTFHYTFARDGEPQTQESDGITDRIGVHAIPTIFVLDRDGKVVTVVQGLSEANEAKLKAALRGLGVKVD